MKEKKNRENIHSNTVNKWNIQLEKKENFNTNLSKNNLETSITK